MTSDVRWIWCCHCHHDVAARPTTGRDVYPHRPDLADWRGWSCPHCHNYTGVHRSTGEPLGTIPTQEIRRARMELHDLIDPVWQTGLVSRSKLYQLVSKELGLANYHIAEINSIEEAQDARFAIQRVIERLRKEDDATTP